MYAGPSSLRLVVSRASAPYGAVKRLHLVHVMIRSGEGYFNLYESVASIATKLTLA